MATSKTCMERQDTRLVGMPSKNAFGYLCVEGQTSHNRNPIALIGTGLAGKIKKIISFRFGSNATRRKIHLCTKDCTHLSQQRSSIMGHPKKRKHDLVDTAKKPKEMAARHQKARNDSILLATNAVEEVTSSESAADPSTPISSTYKDWSSEGCPNTLLEDLSWISLDPRLSKEDGTHLKQELMRRLPLEDIPSVPPLSQRRAKPLCLFLNFPKSYRTSLCPDPPAPLITETDDPFLELGFHEHDALYPMKVDLVASSDDDH